MFPGSVDDGGFIEAGYRGLLRIRDELGIPVRYVDGVAPDEEAMKTALRELADSGAKLVIAHGGQASEAVQRVAWEFPQQRFVSIQGHLTRPNLAVYEVLQDIRTARRRRVDSHQTNVVYTCQTSGCAR
jgi:basic membrane protein A